MEYIIHSSTGELYHHGIKGQKWGVKNGPPYPLEDGQYSRSEKVEAEKVGDRSTIKNKNRKTLKKIGLDESRLYTLRALGTIGLSSVVAVMATKALIDGDISSEQAGSLAKTALIGAITAGSVAVATDWDEIRDTLVPVNSKKTKNDKEFAEKGGFNTFDPSTKTEKELLSEVNKDLDPYMRSLLEMDDDALQEKMKNMTPSQREYFVTKANENSMYLNNCTFCSYAFELRNRGIDASAGATSQGKFNSRIESWFQGGTVDQFKGKTNAETLRNAKNYYGENTRGIITVQWKAGGGHAMNWSIDKEGNFTIYDGQANRIYNTSESIDKLMAKTDNVSTSFLRTDNLELNYASMNRDHVVKKA